MGPQLLKCRVRLSTLLFRYIQFECQNTRRERVYKYIWIDYVCMYRPGFHDRNRDNTKKHMTA